MNQWTLCWAFVLAQSAWAQTLPSAGGQMQQMPIVPVLPALPAVLVDVPTPATAVHTPPAPGALSADVAFTVHAVQVLGATRFTPAELLAVAGFEAGQTRNLPALQSMADRITRHYQQRGYLLARAYLPAQEIRDGVVRLAVLEGQYGEIRLNNTSTLDNAVAQNVLAGLQAGEVIALGALETRLLRLTDVPGVQVRSTLLPGASQGLSDWVVEVSPGPRLSGSVDADNAGNRYTGTGRIGATVNLNNPSGLGDLASLRVLTSGEGLRYMRAAYHLPLGPARVGLAYSDLAYRLGHAFEELQAHGRARTFSLLGQYAWVRSRQSNVNSTLSLTHKEFQDRLDAVPSDTEKHVSVATAALSAEHRDTLGGAGLTNFMGALSAGRVDIQTPSARAQDSQTARSHGPFSKLDVSVSRWQRVTPSVSVYAAWSGQVASKNLDISEKMALGGMNGVRAYPEGEGYADEAYLLTLELRKQLAMVAHPLAQVQLVAFIDVGTLRANHQAWSTSAQRRELSGAGVGVYWTQARDLSVKAFYARKLGAEKPLSAPDQDGRFWVQAVKYF